ncbi:MAG: T9SS type A sorting domain-containing protein [Bacteroidota bacterium]
MKTLSTFFKTLFPVIIFALIFALPAETFADQTKSKGFSGGVRSALTSLRSKKVYTGKTTSTSRMIADTTAKIQYIKNKGGDKYEVILTLPNDIAQIEINVYNILGRKMGDVVWKGSPKKNDEGYEIEVSGLPEGMYICVVQGKDFRLAEKFVISR